MARPTRARLDADALLHNAARVRALAPKARIMAVVKADAYGHGLEWAARNLRDVDAFGVASIEEGERLRKAGVRQPVALLEGFYSTEELAAIAEHGFEPVVHRVGQAQALAAHRGKPFTVWLKIDTGMHRLGVALADVASVVKLLKQAPGVGEVRLMSHLANADVLSDASTQGQIDCFLAAAPADFPRSLANSAGIVGWPASHLDWVRPGIMLYGVSPIEGRSAQEFDLRPVMTFETELIAVARRRRGDAIGYGGTWRCPEDMPIGVAAVGYGDGYPRHAVPGTPVLVNGHPAPLVGRVSMDMITLDLRACPDADVGARVVLWGKGLPVEKVAVSAGTIGYELLCHVTARVPRVDAS